MQGSTTPLSEHLVGSRIASWTGRSCANRDNHPGSHLFSSEKPPGVSSGINDCGNKPVLKLVNSFTCKNVHAYVNTWKHTRIYSCKHWQTSTLLPSVNLYQNKHKGGLEHLRGFEYQMLVLKWSLYAFT